MADWESIKGIVRYHNPHAFSQGTETITFLGLRMKLYSAVIDIHLVILKSIFPTDILLDETMYIVVCQASL